MAKRFEVGKRYGAEDAATEPITILKRTAKTITAASEFVEGVPDTFTMRVNIDGCGNEYAWDSRYPRSFGMVYKTEYEIGGM